MRSRHKQEGPTEVGPSGSATEAEALDDRAVALDLGLLQVVQQTTALADEQQQTTTAVVVVLVLLEVLREVADAVAEQRDLHLGRAGVALGRGVLGDDLLLGLRVGTDRHAGSLPALAVPREPAWAAHLPAGTTQVVRTVSSHEWCRRVWCTVTQAWSKDADGTWTKVRELRSS